MHLDFFTLYFRETASELTASIEGEFEEILTLTSSKQPKVGGGGIMTFGIGEAITEAKVWQLVAREKTLEGPSVEK